MWGREREIPTERVRETEERQSEQWAGFGGNCNRSCVPQSACNPFHQQVPRNFFHFTFFACVLVSDDGLRAIGGCRHWERGRGGRGSSQDRQCCQLLPAAQPLIITRLHSLTVPPLQPLLQPQLQHSAQIYVVFACAFSNLCAGCA